MSVALLEDTPLVPAFWQRVAAMLAGTSIESR
jgi:hypothetical protein